MENKDYITAALVTENKDIQGITFRVTDPDILRALHAVMGLCTESGEALDALKKHIFYAKQLDVVNLQEELGDLFWYAAILADVCQFTFEDTMDKNIKKLMTRYPDKFTEKAAVLRDLEAEREVLEGK